MLFNIEDLAELQASVATPDNGTISTLYITRSVSNGFATDYEVAYKKGVGSLLEVPAPALSDLSSTLAAFAAALASLDTADWDDSRSGIPQEALPAYLHEDALTATIDSAVSAGVTTGAPVAVAPLLPSGGRTTLALGDSHTAGVGVTAAPQRSFPRQMRHAAGTYYASTANAVIAGYPGETTTQLLARLPALLAANPTTDTLVFEGGANDINQSVPIATTAANWQAVTTLCRQKGVNVILVGVPPKPTDVSVTDAMCRQIESLNTLLLIQAPRWGAVVADIHPTLADPATGRLKSIYTDVPTLHMNNLAHYLIANVIGALLRKTYPQQPLPVPTQAIRKINLCQNGGFLDGTAPLPTGWTSITDTAGTVTTSTITVDVDTTGLLPFGKWLTMDVTMGASAGAYGRAYDIGAIAAGKDLALTGYILVEDVSGDWVANCAFDDITVYSL
jgi:lysophospholipase L1-like esterase